MKSGRPNNLEISSSDKEVITLIRHINEKILPGKNTLKEKASFFSQLAKENKFKIAESELKNKFFGPFTKGQNIHLSKEYIWEIDKFLRHIKDQFDIDIAVISDFKNKYAPDELEKRPVRKASSEIINKLFLSTNIPKHLENSEWIVFERIGDEPLKGADWGIAVGRIFFDKIDMFLAVRMNTIYKQLNRTYQGIATQDTQKCLFLDLLKLEDNTRSNIVLQLSDIDIQSQSLIIGHYTFYSPSNAYNHILSKTIVLLKIINNVNDKELFNNYLPIGNYNHDSSQYAQISQEIKTFLYNRQMSRMSMPNKKIGDLHDLNTFFLNQRKKKVNSALVKYFINDYLVYYKIDNTIVEDKLSISYNQDCIKLVAQYTHCPDVDKKHNKIWLGDIYINDSNNGVSIELSSEKHTDRIQQEDPILLSFWIPTRKVSYNESQCFAGVVSGLEDSSNGPISYICLAIKKDISGFLGINDLRLQKYFSLQTSTILVPREVHFKLDDYL